MPEIAAPANTGITRLAAALTGGDAIESNAQANAQYALNRADAMEADLDRKITEAVLKRDQRKAQQAYADSFRATGMDAANAAAQQNFAIGGLTSNLGDAQEYDMKRRAEQALLAEGQVTGSNAILGALEGKPLEHTAIDGNMVVANRYGDAVLDTTPIAESMIAANNALVGQRNASANLDTVKAQAGGFAPRTPAAAGGQIVRTGGGDGAPLEYVDSGNNATARARKIIEDAIAGGGTVMGYSPQSVKRDMADDGHATVDTNLGANELRFITPYGVRDVPLGDPLAPQAAPAAAPVAESLPQQAMARLREGVNTTFGNGQVWTLRDGVAVRVQ